MEEENRRPFLGIQSSQVPEAQGVWDRVLDTIDTALGLRPKAPLPSQGLPDAFLPTGS